jgi:hypothetical protein
MSKIGSKPKELRPLSRDYKHKKDQTSQAEHEGREVASLIDCSFTSLNEDVPDTHTLATDNTVTFSSSNKSFKIKILFLFLY